ncbi:hypothetical protein [Dongia sp.]|jgi:hypothetical protein|uniref:hypothetical protein n=1 Tax=Dongia sp. TaxID=1977262 RepID=UPI0035B1FCB1
MSLKTAKRGAPRKFPEGDDRIALFLAVLARLLGNMSLRNICRLYSKAPKRVPHGPRAVAYYFMVMLAIPDKELETMRRLRNKQFNDMRLADRTHPHEVLAGLGARTQIGRHPLDSYMAWFDYKLAALTGGSLEIVPVQRQLQFGGPRRYSAYVAA